MGKKYGKYREKYYNEYFEYLWERMQKERKKEKELKLSYVQTVANDTFYLEKYSDRDFLSWLNSEKTLNEAEKELKKLLSNRKKPERALKDYFKYMTYFRDFLKSQYNPITTEEIEKCSSVENLVGKEKYALTKIRINQGAIRKNSLKKYNSRCAICNMNAEELLIASHIKAWTDSTESEKGDVDNILLLCPNHDALFDKHYISFDAFGQIIISPQINSENQKLLNINTDMHIELSDKMKDYMDYHRKLLK